MIHNFYQQATSMLINFSPLVIDAKHFDSISFTERLMRKLKNVIRFIAVETFNSTAANGQATCEILKYRK
jgi:hypothetical protein